jgi:chromate reductase, NAD(P)H dehydrogenase (quinone)
MTPKKMKVLGISGSLRPGSSANVILQVAANLAPAEADFNIYQKLGSIPAFNDSREIPLPVADFIQLVREADAVFFCIPEYAFGVPGALKNALDWTVSSTVFSDKPVALITAASNGEKAHASMALTLGALGSILTEQTKLLIPFIRTKLDEKGAVNDPGLLMSINSVIQSLIQTVNTRIITAG